jgi:ABC-type Mn2+/Zn2+ transport system permease subunit
MEKIAGYFLQYQGVISLSLLYFAATAYVGLLLILRRASLFGMVLSQVAQVSFLLGLATAAAFRGHEHVFAMINRSATPAGSDWHFLEIDAFVSPITLLLLIPFVYAAVKGIRNKETLLVLGLLFFLAAYPLINKMSGGGDAVLAKAYFTEILYTPPAMFVHYLPVVVFLVGALIALHRRMLLSGFDPVQARLMGLNPILYDTIFYFVAGLVLSVAVRILGAYVSMAALIVPAFLALHTQRLMVSVVVATLAYAVALPVTGFVVAFGFDGWSTEPIVTVYMIAAGAAVLATSSLIRFAKARR